ncbi:ankyrin repeat and SOCS box protein 5 isoform X1 [Coturnix japonica]|uniref:Ankyrin repeat and SOCS box containing 5 n=1 Tax=Coturnix japonica TaxID=93934 RepID=A0A8C2TC90_COTJA|nr:ankyrin repeat and SOCS box protein 5 isoform X1 [Coturnix japonica]XP_015717233.1 ankyrin repeat and SOCS box protein 5 isoform X1 [Coturnix japonica]
MTVIEESRPFAQQLSNVYFTILSLFCFKLFVKISLAILSHFYIVKGNRKEAARIAAEFYGVPQGQGSWADRSPLHEAASQGRLLSLKTLLSQGYNVDTLTIDQVTPLHEACLGDHVGCARILLEAGANVNATTIDGVTPLFNACSRGSAACAELLLEYGAKAQWESCLPSPTHEAASRGHSECLEVLISWGIDVDQDLPHLGTPLYVACVSQQIHCIRKLLYAGANVQKGKHMETPLHAAAQHSSTEIVNLLLEFGADINAKNTDFERPVDLAAPRSLVERLLLLHEATPSSLCQLCRLRIRNYLGRARLHLIPQLQLPTILKNFLQYR